MIAALYIRVSTAEQANRGYSLDAQTDLLKRYCDDNSITVYKLYADEGKSANKALSKRTALLQMVKDAEAKLFDTILFKDITRWSRNSAQYYAVQERLDKCGCSWMAVEQPYLETRSPTGRFTVSVMLGTAQLESENIGQRIRFVADSMARNRIVPYSDRLAPVGYEVKIIDGSRRLVQKDSERDMMRDMFDHLLTHHNQAQAMRFILDKYGRDLKTQRMSKICHDRIYIGEYRGISNFCEPYITEEQFNSLQVFSRNFREAKFSKNYIFRGLLKCEECGATMLGNTVPHKRIPDQVYYRCPNHYIYMNCSMSHQARQDRVEKKMLDLIKPAFDKMLYTVDVEQPKQDNSKRIKQIQSKLERLTEVYIDGAITREQYAQRKTDLQRQISDLSRSEQSNIEELRNILNSPWREVYDELSKEDRGVFWRTIIDRIVYDGETIKNVRFKT